MLTKRPVTVVSLPLRISVAKTFGFFNSALVALASLSLTVFSSTFKLKQTVKQIDLAS